MSQNAVNICFNYRYSQVFNMVSSCHVTDINL